MIGFIIGGIAAAILIAYTVRPRAKNRDAAIIAKINKELARKRGKKC